MNINESGSLIRKYIKDLEISLIEIPGTSPTVYNVKNVNKVRNALVHLKDIPFIKPEIEGLLNSWILTSTTDEVNISGLQYANIADKFNKLKAGLEYVLRIANSSDYSKDKEVLYIKLPELKTFDDLSKASNDLKKGIEQPIYDDTIGGEVNILSAESGSVWLIVSVGTIAAVNLVAAICWAAAVIRKKNAEAKIFEQHAKTLEIKNAALDDIVDAQKKQLNNILTAEADAISTKHYNYNAPETTERLKLAINTVADLIDRGAQILPASNDPDSLKAFPNYNQLELITSSIKQLTNN